MRSGPGPYKPAGRHFEVAQEETLLTLWETHRVFERSVENRRGQKPFVFYEGPPTANGAPHPGHLLTKAMKDLFPRYFTMTGHCCERKAGWDTHGLPVEIEVEKQLGLKSREEVVEYGVEKFAQLCRESVWKYKGEWETTVRRGGFWIDMQHPYITLDNSYIESVWWVLKQLHEKDLLYKGHKVVPYCPLTGTVLSSHEVSQGYKEVEDPSVFVLMERESAPGEFFLVWTTTPWTLPANVALALAPKADYARVKLADGRIVILAKALVEKVLAKEENPYEILNTLQGKKLVGERYKRLFTDLPVEKGETVLAGEFVTLEDGTGIVHLAPAFGEEDYKMGRSHGLSLLDPITPQGTFSEAIGWLAGQYFKDADKTILRALKDNNLLYRREQFKHNYPFNWRRPDSPLMYRARESWFVAMTQVKDRLLKNNQSIHWHPEHIKDGRFGDFLGNVVDWALSRNRFWGTPLPVWICEGCAHELVAGSVKELETLSGKHLADLDLHKPYVDELTFTCPQCQQATMRRVPEVIDCWFDSGAMPYAQWHYPFDEKNRFEDRFPADFICEAIDQTRGWFYSMLAIATALDKPAPYRHCLVLGHILDKNGQKMSKSKGNAVSGFDMMNTYGADAVRWTLYAGSDPWLPKRFYPEVVADARRRFLGTLHNVYSFFVLYANLDHFTPDQFAVPFAERHELDRWILSRLSQLIREVRERLEDYDVAPAARAIEYFVVEELSNWYLRRSRERFWASEWSTEKKAAFLTLHEVLVKTAQIAAPFTPFITEEIWRNLTDAEAADSVHLTDYPSPTPSHEDTELDERMALARRLSELGRCIRQEARQKVRQPLACAYIKAPKDQHALIQRVWPIVAEEINVKALDLPADFSQYALFQVQINFKEAGPVLGARVKEAQTAMKGCDCAKVAEALEKDGHVTLQLADGPVDLKADMVRVDLKTKEGFAVGRDGDLMMALDVRLTDELLREGLAREFNNRVNARRKDMNLNISDRVEAMVFAGREVMVALKEHEAFIKENGMLRALRFLDKPCPELPESEKLNEHDVRFVLKA